jgi:hypothetical protein
VVVVLGALGGKRGGLAICLVLLLFNRQQPRARECSSCSDGQDTPTLSCLAEGVQAVRQANEWRTVNGEPSVWGSKHNCLRGETGKTSHFV